jgi:hypothetical protein
MVNAKAVDDSAWNGSTWHVDEVDCDGWRQVVYPHGGGPWRGLAWWGRTTIWDR